MEQKKKIPVFAMYNISYKYFWGNLDYYCIFLLLFTENSLLIIAFAQRRVPSEGQAEIRTLDLYTV